MYLTYIIGDYEVFFIMLLFFDFLVMFYIISNSLFFDDLLQMFKFTQHLILNMCLHLLMIMCVILLYFFWIDPNFDLSKLDFNLIKAHVVNCLALVFFFYFVMAVVDTIMETLYFKCVLPMRSFLQPMMNTLKQLLTMYLNLLFIASCIFLYLFPEGMKKLDSYLIVLILTKPLHMTASLFLLMKVVFYTLQCMDDLNWSSYESFQKSLMMFIMYLIMALNCEFLLSMMISPHFFNEEGYYFSVFLLVIVNIFDTLVIMYVVKHDLVPFFKKFKFFSNRLEWISSVYFTTPKFFFNMALVIIDNIDDLWSFFFKYQWDPYVYTKELAQFLNMITLLIFMTVCCAQSKVTMLLNFLPLFYLIMTFLWRKM